MDVVALEIPDVKLIRLTQFRDGRGIFCETYNRRALSLAGIGVDFIQDNCSISRSVGTVRGLHFQAPPFAQAKLVMVLRGRVFDVVVDCRQGSSTFGRHLGIALGSDDWNQLFVPEGFAHGFCTLEPDTLVQYKVSAPYAPQHERGIFWNDPDLGIAWPVTEEAAVVSEKDQQLPRLCDLAPPFSHAGQA